MPHFYQVVFQMEGIIFTVQNKWSGLFLVGLLFLSLTYKTNDSILMWKIQTEDKIDGQDIVVAEPLWIIYFWIKMCFCRPSCFSHHVKSLNQNKGFGFGFASRTLRRGLCGCRRRATDPNATTVGNEQSILWRLGSKDRISVVSSNVIPCICSPSVVADKE